MNRLLFAFVLLFVFLAEIFLPRMGKREISFQPKELLSLSQYTVGSSSLSLIDKLRTQTAQQQGATITTIPFRLGLYYGFHDQKLNLLSYDALKEPLPLSHQILGSDFYLDLFGDSQELIIRDIGRTEIGRIPRLKSTFIVKDTIYQFQNEGHSLFRYSSKGELEWRSDLLPYISSLDTNDRGDTLISYVNGRVVLLNRQGELDNEYISSGSRINSVYGAALSADSQNIALIAGLDQQRFVFLKKQQTTYLFEYALRLDDPLRRSQWLQFSADHPYVFYSNTSGVTVYNFRRRKNRLYHAAGDLNRFGEQGNIQFFVFNSGAEGTLLATHGTQGELLRVQLSGNHYSLQVQETTIYFGQDNLIASYQTEYL